MYCTILEARNWNIKKALKMLKGSLKWRLDYKPEEIRWEEVAAEAETGKIYRTNIRDRHGRSILVMRPGREIRYLVYCMENAILNLRPGQSQMVWLIDYDGKETAHILQDHYPERLGVAVLYNPPKFFEPFWKKVRFVYTDDPSSSKIMEDVFGMDRLESALGADSQLSFDYEEYANRMREDDKRIPPSGPGEKTLTEDKQRREQRPKSLLFRDYRSPNRTTRPEGTESISSPRGLPRVTNRWMRSLQGRPHEQQAASTLEELDMDSNFKPSPGGSGGRRAGRERRH
ncbi:unnamed protein product [Spirodela intermedia]|uniref:CRAL-TRIO domain-containing protein n=1 Tax=Spirodela intermedia TaxID=51605 RepID=A0A7I8INW5_SPIIN|nr:unnamed protein product [Spirodela intermedia]CAA6659470.1 unnamed protein product [Spirodela intermedia]